MSKARDIASAAPAPAGVTSTELGYVDGVTSALQTQINSKIGQSTAINPTIVDAKGDIIAATAADTVARLAVGANNTVLTADSAETTGLKWAAASSGALVRITTQSFTSSTAINIDSAFSSTYDNYLILLNINSASTVNNLRLRFRTSGTTNTTSNYSNTWTYNQHGTTTVGYLGNSSPSDNMYMHDITNAATSTVIDLFNPNTAQKTIITYKANQTNFYGVSGAGQFNTTTSFDGIALYPDTGNISGTISIYGYTKA